LLRTKRSLSTQSGFFGSCFIMWKYSATRMSAADSEPPGCPEPASYIILIEWALTFLAIVSNSPMNSASYISKSASPWAAQRVVGASGIID
jgi:hypothetical protein